MKKLMIITALALVAGAAFNSAEAAKKKKEAAQPQTPVVAPVVLATSSDSVSYTAGMAVTNGLVPYLIQQGVDTAHIADFIRGFKEVIENTVTPQMKAYSVGLEIANQVKERVLPGMTQEFTDTPDSIIPSPTHCSPTALTSSRKLLRIISRRSRLSTSRLRKISFMALTAMPVRSSWRRMPRRTASSPLPAACSTRCSSRATVRCLR